MPGDLGSSGQSRAWPTQPRSSVVRNVAAEDDVAMAEPYALLGSRQHHDARPAPALGGMRLDVGSDQRIVAKDVFVDVVLIPLGFLHDGVDMSRDPAAGIGRGPDRPKLVAALAICLHPAAEVPV